MKCKRNKSKKIALLLMFCMLLGLTACGAEEPLEANHETEEITEVTAEQEEFEPSEEEFSEGEKTVYAKANANGAVKEITMETLIMDADGEEYRHKEASTETLPINVNISYYLNDELTEPEEIAGKSGKIKIRIDYENVTDLTPFLVITAMVLPSDVFSNIEIENGELIAMEGQRMAVGYALPGVADYLKLQEYEPTEELEIPEYVEIVADAKEFELSFTATVMTNGIFSELEDTDLDDLEEMADSMDDLKEAVDEMLDGTAELYDGMKEFHDYLGDYQEGVEAVAEGTEALSEGLALLNENKDDLEDGVKALSKGIDTLYQSLVISESTNQNEKSDENTDENTTDFDSVIAAVKKELALSEEEKDQFDTLVMAILGNEQTDTEKNTLLALISMLLTNASEQSAAAMITTLTNVKSAVGELQKGSNVLVAGVEAFNDGIGELYDGSVELYEGCEELSEAGEELYDGFEEVVDAVGELKDGVAEFNDEAVKELEKLAGKQLRDIISKLRSLKAMDQSWDGFSGARIILETETI